MTHTITYTATAEDVSDDQAIGLVKAVASWEQQEQMNHFDGVSYDRVNDAIRLSLRRSEVTEINTALSEMDKTVSDLNSTYQPSFQKPSETADIRPSSP